MTHVTPYDRLAFGAEEAERMLATGEHERELCAFFGEAEYRELVSLAREARSHRRPAGPRVYVLPGIMGSQLGLTRAAPLPPDVIWLDPIDIAFGRLFALRLGSQSRIVSLGAMLYGFLRLKLEIERAGFDVVLHDYDWRRGVVELGETFAGRVREDGRDVVHVVAHSMGGLVARAALLAPGMERVVRLVMLGTPNLGSFAPLQALRGVYPVVRRVAALDLRHSAEELAREIFTGFPSLYDLLPMSPVEGALDLFDAASWPKDGPQPNAELLAASRALEQRLAPADARTANIVGIGQDTVTSASFSNEEFRYTITRNGDGTVPAALATLPGARNYYTPVVHGELPRNRPVASAVVDLLRGGETQRLASDWSPTRRPAVQVTESQLRRTHCEKIDWAALEPEERRRYLEHLNDPPEFARTRAPASAVRSPASGTRGHDPARPGRARARRTSRPRLELSVAARDVATADVQALVGAIFSGVRPAGALAAIDARIGGVIEQFSSRRMLSGETGNIVAIPAVRGLPHARHVLIAGIGRFDRLDEDALQLAAQNVVRWCAHSRIRAFATVLWGVGAGFDAARSFTSQARGYAQAIAEAGGRWRIAFCIPDRRQLAQVASAAHALEAKAAELPVRLDLRIGAAAATRKGRSGRTKSRAGRRVARPRSTVPQTCHLVIGELPAGPGRCTWRAALLTAGRQAAVIAESRDFATRALETELRRLDGLTLDALPTLGARLAELLLHPNVRAGLHAMRDHPLALVHETAGAQVPWETLRVRSWFPAAGAGLSRRYAAEDLPVARFNESQREDRPFAVLLVANPTGDLPGAELERERIVRLLAQLRTAKVTTVEGRAATRARLLAELRSGEYDLVHYAGHAFFDAKTPARSGILCSDGVLAGADLGELAQLPALVVFNACESGRVRRANAAAQRKGRARDSRRSAQLRAHTGLAEAFLRGGVAHYVGTYWPVGDAEAVAFAEALYRRLLSGSPIGDAVLEGRRAVKALRSVDWADYIHYGDPMFRLKSV